MGGGEGVYRGCLKIVKNMIALASIFSFNIE